MIERIKERRRNREKRSRQRRKRQTKISGAEGHLSVSISGNGIMDLTEERPPAGSMLLIHAIRTTGILPIVALISILLTHHFYTAHIPRWFHPIVQQDVAVLTLCAGHAGIVGISISLRRVRLGWSTYALAIAAIATAGAGYRAIGEDLAGHIVIISLFLLLAPSIWAELLSRVALRLWRITRSKKALIPIIAVGWLGLVYYNQLQDENFIRNWLLIPLLVILGILLTAIVLWLLIGISSKFLPIAFSLVKHQARNTFTKLVRKAKRKK